MRQPESISIVVPVSSGRAGRGGNDLELFETLLTTFFAFFNVADVAKFVVVTPIAEMKAATDALQRFPIDDRFEVVSDESILPEVNAPLSDTQIHKLNEQFVFLGTLLQRGDPLPGWLRQQALKLAVAEKLVETEWYLVLDADVLVARACGVAELFVEGRARCGSVCLQDFKRLYTDLLAQHEVEVNARRYLAAERLLGMKRQSANKSFFYTESPVVLHRATVEALLARIGDYYKLRWFFALLQELPWTDYSLYFTFLEASGAIDDLYQREGVDAVLRLTQCLWHDPEHYEPPRSLSNWDVAAAFDADASGYFTVVQSYLGYDPKQIRAAIQAYIPR